MTRTQLIHGWIWDRLLDLVGTRYFGGARRGSDRQGVQWVLVFVHSLIDLPAGHMYSGKYFEAKLCIFAHAPGLHLFLEGQLYPTVQEIS